MIQRSSHSLRRAAGLLTVFAMALSLPGVSHANHNTCTQQGSSDPNQQRVDACPEFSPAFNLSIHYPYRNTPAKLNFEVSQAYGESNMLRWEVYLPKEWRFNTTLREAKTVTGEVPSSCHDLFINTNDEANLDGPGGFQRNDAPNAEAVSDSNRVETWNGTSFNPDGDPSRLQFTQKRGMYFWKTEGTRTTLCSRFTRNLNHHWTVPIYLDRLAISSESPYGWKITVPVETLRQQGEAQGWWTESMSLTTLDIELHKQTSGTWHLANGIPSAAIFSRAPRDPVQTKIGTRAFTCTNGAKTLANACNEPAPYGPGAILQYPYPTDTQHEEPLAEFPFVVNLPPVTFPQPWAKLTKAGEVLLPGAGKNQDHPVSGFGFSDDLRRKGNSLSVTWNPLTEGLAPGIEVVGYALVLHKITRHQNPSTIQEEAAGRVLYKREFSNGDPFTISFDLDDLPENAALGNVEGKYNVSLVTIYNTPFGNGYRSDGLCDGMLSGADPTDTGQGVLCPPGRPIWLASGTPRQGGISSWQAIVREDAWPRKYLMSQSGQPFQLLLLDIPNKQAELTIWGSYVVVPGDSVGSGALIVSTETVAGQDENILLTMGQGRADEGPSTVFQSSGNIMYEPAGPIPGLLQFGSIDVEGEGFDNWWFTGRVGGEVDALFVPPIGTSHAYGILEQYAPRNSDLDWLSPFLADPCTENTPERGCGPEDAYPETITSDFTGVRF